MKLHLAITRFMDSRTASGYASNTLKNNLGHLQLLERCLPAGYEVHQVTPDKAEKAWVQILGSRKPGSAKQCLSTYRMFFRWCHSRGYTKPGWVPPFDDIRTPQAKARERLRVPASHFPSLLDAAPDGRDRALLAAAITTMLRQSELQTIRLEDVNLDDGEIIVTIHKTNDSDRMPIPRELDTELRRWLTEYTQQCGPLQPHWYLFPSRQQQSWGWDEDGNLEGIQGGHYGYVPTQSVVHMEQVAQRALSTLGYQLEKGEGMHTLRRSAARALFDRLATEGYDGALRLVQAMLHHAQSSTTEHYLGLTLDKKRRDDIIRGESMYPAWTAASKIRKVS